MQRKKGNVCVYYNKQRGNWRVQVTRADRKRTTHTVATEELAEEIAAHARAQQESEVQTVAEAIDMYLDELMVQGCSGSHLVSTRARLRMMFPDAHRQGIGELHPLMGKILYSSVLDRISPRTGKRYAVDTARNSLLQSRAMCVWLMSKGVIDSNPFDGVKGVGRRKRGKKQLTIDEARKFADACFSEGSPGSTAALCCLLLAMRAGEIVGLTARSIDDGGRLLRIDEAKTAAGVRLIEIPEPMRALLPALVAEDIDRHWVNRQVHRMCKLAGVTDVGPHALRGTHASLATRAGATSQLVADTLGHASVAVTHGHYTQRSAVSSATTRTALTVLAGGKS